MNIDTKFICSQTIITDNYVSSLKDLDIEYQNIEINNEKMIQKFTENFTGIKFKFFDMFVADEFYSHNIKADVSILDTQDLHFLREIRRSLYETSNGLIDVIKYDNDYLKSFNFDKLFLENPIFLREMAAILRNDFVIVSSDFEFNLLTKLFKLPENKIIYLPFFYENKNFEITEEIFNKKKDFVFIGNYLHKPNKDSIIYTAKNIFPKIINEFLKYDIKTIPSLYIFGVNIDKDIKSLENEHIKVKGEMKNISQLSKYRVLLAPIVYGAGIKGKITDSWDNMVPVVTSYYGCESLFINKFQPGGEETTYNDFVNIYIDFIKSNENNFGGFISNSSADFAKKAFMLYTDKTIWLDKISIGLNTLKNNMTFDKQFRYFNDSILDSAQSFNLTNYIQYVVRNESNSANKFKSKYIEIKNKFK
jgi:hypothetical protein